MVFGPSPLWTLFGAWVLALWVLGSIARIGPRTAGLIRVYAMDVQVSLTALNETFVSECVRFPCVHAAATTPAQRLNVSLRSFSSRRISLPR